MLEGGTPVGLRPPSVPPSCLGTERAIQTLIIAYPSVKVVQKIGSRAQQDIGRKVLFYHEYAPSIFP